MCCCWWRDAAAMGLCSAAVSTCADSTFRAIQKSTQEGQMYQGTRAAGTWPAGWRVALSQPRLPAVPSPPALSVAASLSVVHGLE